jgi:hypothetical protein
MKFLALALVVAPQVWAQPSAPVAADDPLRDLVKIRRIYVEPFTGGDTANQLRDMIVASVMATKLYLVTEDPDKADAVLKGSAEDMVFTDRFSSSDSISAHVGVRSTDGAAVTSQRSSRGLTAGVGQQESTKIAERKHEANASVRLVNKSGDVVWSTTQESQGAKFRSASADVADRVAKKLADDFARVKRAASPHPGS